MLESIDPRGGEMVRRYHELNRDIATAYHQLKDWDGTSYGMFSKIRILAGLGRYDETLATAKQAASWSFAGLTYWLPDIICVAALEIEAHGGPAASLAARTACLDVVVQVGPLTPDSVRWLERLGDALFRLDRLNEASVVYQDILRLRPDIDRAVGAIVNPANLTALGRLGVIAARQGDYNAAVAWNSRLEMYVSDYTGGQPTLWRAKIAAARGDRAQAIALIRQAFNQGISSWHNRYGDFMHTQVELAQLFDDPAYQEIVAPND